MNSVSVLSTNPLTVEISDCIACGASVPEATRWETHTDEGGTIRYRLCARCTCSCLGAMFLGGVTLERAKARFAARLSLISAEAVRRAALIDGMQTRTRQ